MMRKRIILYVMPGVMVLLLVSAASAADDLAARLQGVLAKGPETRFWQVTADSVHRMIKAKRKDFLIVDVRPRTTDYTEGHIPGSIHIMTQDMFKHESLKKLPKNKKVILVCATGQIQNLPLIGLRLLGYDAYVMAFGYSAWIKGYAGGVRMQEAIQNAADMDYPVEK